MRFLWIFRPSFVFSKTARSAMTWGWALCGARRLVGLRNPFPKTNQWQFQPKIGERLGRWFLPFQRGVSFLLVYVLKKKLVQGRGRHCTYLKTNNWKSKIGGVGKMICLFWSGWFSGPMVVFLGGLNIGLYLKKKRRLVKPCEYTYLHIYILRLVECDEDMIEIR